jgi:hypothetical protein
MARCVCRCWSFKTSAPCSFRSLHRSELGPRAYSDGPSTRAIAESEALLADDRQKSVLRRLAVVVARQFALRWSDVDFDAGVLRHRPLDGACRSRPDAFLRYQLSRGTGSNPSRLVPLKTDTSARGVVLSGPLAALLRDHRKRQLSRGLAGGSHFVFSTRNGTPLSHRNAARAITDASAAAELERVGFHVLRHGFASALIVGLGLDPVQVSRQLGHAAPSITLDVYAHLFDRARHAEDIRTRIASSGLAAAVTRGACEDARLGQRAGTSLEATSVESPVNRGETERAVRFVPTVRLPCETHARR